MMGTSLRDNSSKGITGGLKVEVVPRWAVGETLLCPELYHPVLMDHFPHLRHLSLDRAPNPIPIPTLTPIPNLIRAAHLPRHSNLYQSPRAKPFSIHSMRFTTPSRPVRPSGIICQTLSRARRAFMRSKTWRLKSLGVRPARQKGC